MKRLVKLLPVLLAFVILAVPLSRATAQVAPKAPAAVKEIPRTPPVADNPVIQSFTVDPAVVVQTDPVTAGWQVRRGPGGSPVVSAVLTVDGVTWFSSAAENFSSPPRAVTWVGEKTFVLTVRNAAGRTATQSKTVRGVSLADALNNLKIVNMEANPPRFSAGQSIDFRVIISNTNPGLVLKPVNIFVTQGTRVVGNRTSLNIMPGNQVINLQDTGFLATGGQYVVDVEFKGRHKTRNFATRQVPMYTIDPTTPQ